MATGCITHRGHATRFPERKGFSKENFRFSKYGTLFAAPRVGPRGSFLNISWSCHGSKVLQVYCPSSSPWAPDRRSWFTSNLGDCSGRKRFPLCRVHRFRWAPRPIPYLKSRPCSRPRPWALLPTPGDCSVDAYRIHNPWRTVSNSPFSSPTSLRHFWHDFVPPTHHLLQHSHHRLFNSLVVRMFS